MKYNVTLNGKIYEVEVERGEAILVNVSDYTVAPTAAPAAASSPTPATPAPKSDFPGETVKSPMPGTILDVKVNTGDVVKFGQVLMILEAMKMENEIVAPRDGTVAQIAVSKGSSVDTGDTLLTLS